MVGRSNKRSSEITKENRMHWCCLIIKLEISASIEVTEELLVLISEPTTHKLWSKSAMNMRVNYATVL